MAAGSERRMALRLLLAFLIEAAVCPYGLNVSSKPTDGGRPPKMRRVGLVAVVAAASVTVASAAAASISRSAVRVGMPGSAAVRSKPVHSAASRGKPQPLCAECEVPPTSSSSPPADAGASSSSEDDDVDEAVDETGDVSGDDNGMEKNAKVPSTHKAAPKTWSNAQFPEGVKPLAANWDLANLAAAQAWTCPCIDRRNCLGAERGITILHLYEHRKTFLTTCNNTGGKRDAMRAQLESHYSSSGKSFTRSFVVGPLADCCSASAALANGVSFQTFANARADLRGNRPSKKRKARRFLTSAVSSTLISDGE